MVICCLCLKSFLVTSTGSHGEYLVMETIERTLTPGGGEPGGIVKSALAAPPPAPTRLAILSLLSITSETGATHLAGFAWWHFALAHPHQTGIVLPFRHLKPESAAGMEGEDRMDLWEPDNFVHFCARKLQCFIRHVADFINRSQWERFDVWIAGLGGGTNS